MPETSKHGNNHGAEGFRDNVVPDCAGVQGDRRSEGRSEPLPDLVGEFVGNMSDGYAKVKMGEVLNRFDDGYFAWIGGFEKDSVFHHRVHSPVMHIEFDRRRPMFMRSPRVPTRQCALRRAHPER